VALRTKFNQSRYASYAPLLWRVLAFIGIFVIVSGILGPRVISGGILYKDHFGIYGGIGKALLFGAIAFLLLASRDKNRLQLLAWQRANLVWLLLAALSTAYAWIGISHLLAGNSVTYWLITTHVCLIAALLFALGGCFGPANLRHVAKIYKRELLYALLLAAAFYGFLELVYGLWKVLAFSVLHPVTWMLHRAGISAVILPPRTLLLSKFGISIAQYCSGIESIALFTGLYVVVGLLDWKRFNHSRYMILFPIGLVVLFGFNILRVFVLILGGYFINPHIAFSLFHTYAGMIFFILYSAVFWSICYRFMLRKGFNKPAATP
jgi:exosortase/archaeosortase family protein